MVEPKDLVGKLVEIDGNKYLVDCVTKYNDENKMIVCIPKFEVTLLAVSQKEEEIPKEIPKTPKGIKVTIKYSEMPYKLRIIKDVKEAFILGLKEAKDSVDEGLTKSNEVVIGCDRTIVNISQLQANLSNYSTFESVNYIY